MTNPIADSTALDRIAQLLGTNPEWSPASDFLDDIALIVSQTGRQHPGDADPETYDCLRPRA